MGVAVTHKQSKEILVVMGEALLTRDKASKIRTVRKCEERQLQDSII